MSRFSSRQSPMERDISTCAESMAGLTSTCYFAKFTSLPLTKASAYHTSADLIGYIGL